MIQTQKNVKQPKEFVSTVDDVISAENCYLHDRRKRVFGKTKNENDRPKNIWGVAFSGGGIRAATFALGVIQGLTRKRGIFPKGIFRRFDYLSTVSGGGYIGSCLSSLLTGETPRVTPSGVDHDNSPFTGLNEEIGYRVAREEGLPQNADAYPCDGEPDVIRNSEMHQIHHLRSHGNYLGKKTGTFSFEIQRIVGTTAFALLYHVVLFALLYVGVIALFHALLYPIAHYDKEAQHSLVGFTYEPAVRYHVSKFSFIDKDAKTLSIVEAVKTYYDEGLREPLANVFVEPFKYMEGAESLFDTKTILPFLVWPGIIGAIEALFISIFAFFLSRKLRRLESLPPLCSTPAGTSRDAILHDRFIHWFNYGSVAFVIVLTLLASNWTNEVSRLWPLLVPMSFSVAAFIVGILAMLALELGDASFDRIRRSLYSALRGAAIYGVLAAFLFPVVLIFMNSLSSISFSAWFGFFLFLAGAFLFGKTKTIAPIVAPEKFFERHFGLILNVLMVITLLAFFVPATKLLIAVYAIGGQSWFVRLVTGLTFVGVASAISMLISSNKLSLHFFYRDRLSEAYLQTDARVLRPETCKTQGKPMITIRNDEHLLLKDLGNGNGCGPYHLINASLNMNGSDELVRKTLKSDHFLFSKYFVGSKTTGFVSTSMYRRGGTTLAGAMTISGAAASSSMGMFSSPAQAFFMTLFNLRLGQWMENPWYYSGRVKRVEKKTTLWLKYLVREMFGRTNAKSRLVNVTDGGHTGDNLGLLPLLQRRCKVIVVVDAEADAKYDFGSFNHAARLAFIEENIRIEIDLTPLQEHRKENDISVSDASATVGLIHYPKMEGKDAETGVLVYLKASVSEWNPMKALEVQRSDPGITQGYPWIEMILKSSEALDTKTLNKRKRIAERRERSEQFALELRKQFDELDWKLPAHVENYNRTNPRFPHESTGDQFFDMQQFESYRALGEHVGGQASAVLALLQLCGLTKPHTM